MLVTLSHSKKIINGKIRLTSSKSESNRALIIKALCDDDFVINDLSDSTDTQGLNNLLISNEKELNVGLAGTSMRFLTAYHSIQNGERILTGSDRMKERPIAVLVDALKQLGADIEYTEKEGFPPLKIRGKQLEGGVLKINGNVSSQYISALLMIAPKLKTQLKIEFIGGLTSGPYIEMTIKMMQHFGVDVFWSGDSIVVNPGKYIAKDFNVESDWSAASYWYAIVALADKADLTLYGLGKDSLQGDAEVQHIFKNFGVETTFVEEGVQLTKNSEFRIQNAELEIDFVKFPDIAQTIAVTCAVLNIKAKLTGLKTLRIKETDRITALKNELNKLGFNVKVEGDDILILPSWRTVALSGVEGDVKQPHYQSNAMANPIKTYNDHRMAMAFAPLALIASIQIENPEVVHKSYPNFWKDMEGAGFKINQSS